MRRACKDVEDVEGSFAFVVGVQRTHQVILMTPSKIKSRRCDAGKTKKNLSLSSLVFIGVAFLFRLFPKGI